MSQSSFGDIGGVTKKTQVLYESGERSPDAQYLAAIAAAGVDVLYVLTGEHGKAAPGASALPPRQQILIANYEAADEEGRRHIEYAALLAAQSLAFAMNGSRHAPDSKHAA
jgi:transcriptional regulator with XRE-family HTH domain